MGAHGGGGVGGGVGVGGGRPWVPVLIVLVLLLALGITVGLSAWRIGYGQATTLAAFRMEQAIEKVRTECHREMTSNTPSELEVGALMRSGHSRQAVRRALRQDREASLTPPPRPVHLLELPELHNESVVMVVQKLHDNHGVRVFVGPESLEDLEELLVWARGRPSPRSRLWFITPTSGSTLASVGSSNDDVTVISLALKEVPLLFMQMERQGVTRVLPVLGRDASGREVAAQLEEMVDYLGVVVDTPLWYSAEVIQKSPSALQDLMSYIDIYFNDTDWNNENAALLLSGGAELGAIARVISASESGIFPWFVTSTFAQPSTWSKLETDHRTTLQNLQINAVMFTGDYHSTKEWRKEVLDEVSLFEGQNLENPYQTALAYDAGLISARIGPWAADSMETLEEADSTQAKVLLARESYTWTGITGNLALTSHLERFQGHFVDLVLDEENYEVLDQFDPYVVRGKFHAMRQDYAVAMRRRSVTPMTKNLKVTVTYSPGSWYHITAYLIQQLSRALPNCPSSYVRYTVSDPASSARTSKIVLTVLLEEFKVSVNHELSLDVICLERNKTARHKADLSLKCPSTFDQSMEVMCSLAKPFQCSFRLEKLESLERCVRRHVEQIVKV